MALKFTDNALTTLATGINNAATQLTVAAGTGANFPAVAGAIDYFIITMEDASGNREFIRCDNRAGDLLGSASYPLQRGYNGSTARSWSAGDSVDLRWNTATIANWSAYGTITNSQPFTWTQTWNNGASTFTAMKVDVTNTASLPGSLLADFRVGGVSKFSIGSSGDIITAGYSYFGNNLVIGNAAFVGGAIATAVINTDNTNGFSNAVNTLSVGGPSAGDPYTVYIVPGITDWETGLDNSANDSYKIACGGFGTGDCLIIAPTGETTLPKQSAFHAVKSANTLDQTGDGTDYQIICDTEIFDQNSDYDNTTGIFTAPVTGRYLFSWTIGLADIGAGHTDASYSLVTSGRTYQLWHGNPAALRSVTDNRLVISGSIIVSMQATNTAVLKANVANSTKTVDVNGNATILNAFSAVLMC